MNKYIYLSLILVFSLLANGRTGLETLSMIDEQLQSSKNVPSVKEEMAFAMIDFVLTSRLSEETAKVLNHGASATIFDFRAAGKNETFQGIDVLKYMQNKLEGAAAFLAEKYGANYGDAEVSKLFITYLARRINTAVTETKVKWPKSKLQYHQLKTIQILFKKFGFGSGLTVVLAKEFGSNNIFEQLLSNWQLRRMIEKNSFGFLGAGNYYRLSSKDKDVSQFRTFMDFRDKFGLVKKRKEIRRIRLEKAKSRVTNSRTGKGSKTHLLESAVQYSDKKLKPRHATAEEQAKYEKMPQTRDLLGIPSYLQDRKKPSREEQKENERLNMAAKEKLRANIAKIRQDKQRAEQEKQKFVNTPPFKLLREGYSSAKIKAIWQKHITNHPKKRLKLTALAKAEQAVGVFDEMKKKLCTGITQPKIMEELLKIEHIEMLHIETALDELVKEEKITARQEFANKEKLDNAAPRNNGSNARNLSGKPTASPRAPAYGKSVPKPTFVRFKPDPSKLRHFRGVKENVGGVSSTATKGRPSPMTQSVFVRPNEANKFASGTPPLKQPVDRVISKNSRQFNIRAALQRPVPRPGLRKNTPVKNNLKKPTQNNNGTNISTPVKKGKVFVRPINRARASKPTAGFGNLHNSIAIADGGMDPQLAAILAMKKSQVDIHTYSGKG